jgi:flagellar hook-associated protein 1 FlgK
MAGIGSLLDLGQKALFASQLAITTTGDNISNVNTPGYHRREVILEESRALDTKPGSIGQGVEAKEVVRFFDRFIESNYNDKATFSERYETLHSNLRTVDSMFNESMEGGLNEVVAEFFTNWQDLSLVPDDYAARQALIADSQSMVDFVRQLDAQMVRLQDQTDDFINQEVGEANEIMQQLAQLNEQIKTYQVDGRTNVNDLFDKRDMLVRDLAEIIDVRTIDNGGGDYTVMTHSGHTLVDGVEAFELEFQGAQTRADLKSASPFEGQVYFSGTDEFEYTIQVVQGGDVSSGAGAAQFKVSLDGGQTFVKDESGADRVFSARPENQKIGVGDLQIWFGQTSNASIAPTTTMVTGDTFNIVPKSGLYWIENTADKDNLTPRILGNGEDDGRRATGGSLSGLFNFRDDYIGRYREKLDAFASSFVWEVNKLHSEGAGLEMFSQVNGTYGVLRDDVALASNSSNLAFRDQLEAGSLRIYAYEESDGSLASSASLDFDPATPGQQNFDPDVHSLQDVAAAFDNAFPGRVSAQIVNGKLNISTDGNTRIAFGQDSTGLLAGLGLNTFFDGDRAANMTINSTVANDLSKVAVGHINGAAEANPGDNTTGVAISELQHKNVSITTLQQGTTQQTLQQYYNSLVGNVGADTAVAEGEYMFNKTLAQDLDARQQEVSGVNLDQEMANMVKFQHSYTAAAKLITTADQMMQTVLTLKN